MTEGYFEVEPGVRLRYIIDDFTDPWRRAETVLIRPSKSNGSEYRFQQVPPAVSDRLIR